MVAGRNQGLRAIGSVDCPKSVSVKFAQSVPPVKTILNGLPVVDGKHPLADPINVAAPVEVFML